MSISALTQPSRPRRLFTPVGKPPLSKPWLNGCISFPPLPCERKPRFVAMAESFPCSPAMREKERERRAPSTRHGPGTQIGRDTPGEAECEGGGGGGRCSVSSRPKPVWVVLRQKAYGGERCRLEEDAHWHRICDSQWLTLETFVKGYDLNLVILCNIPIVHRGSDYSHPAGFYLSWFVIEILCFHWSGVSNTEVISLYIVL